MCDGRVNTTYLDDFMIMAHILNAWRFLLGAWMNIEMESEAISNGAQAHGLTLGGRNIAGTRLL